MASPEHSSEISQPSRPGLRRFGLIVAAAAACLLAFGSLSRAWWTGGEETHFGVGLRGVELCGDAGCTDRGLESLGAPTDTWEHIGIAAFSSGVVAAFFLLLVVAAALRGRALRFPARIGAAACFFAAGMASAFVFFAPDLPDMSPSFGMAAFYLGAALGAGSAGAVLAPSAR